LGRNANKWTEARYWGFIRSGLRRMSMRWPPRNEVKNDARRPYKGEDKRRKFEYQCSNCKKWFKGADVQVDHIVECGTLKTAADLPKFVETLFCEKDNMQLLCKGCHMKKRGK